MCIPGTPTWAPAAPQHSSTIHSTGLICTKTSVNLYPAVILVKHSKLPRLPNPSCLRSLSPQLAGELCPWTSFRSFRAPPRVLTASLYSSTSFPRWLGSSPPRPLWIAARSRNCFSNKSIRTMGYHLGFAVIVARNGITISSATCVTTSAFS